VVVELARGEKGFSATTDNEGQFRFEGISEGDYKLGVNVRQRKGSLPRSLALDEIHVKPGGVIQNLALVVPDPGAQRTIILKVVDQSGRPVPGAYIDDARASDDQGALHGPGLDVPETDTLGQATTLGWQKVSYSVRAFWQKGPAFRDWFQSDVVNIPAGDGPVTLTLTLRPISNNSAIAP
jgi:hypothetical protein